MNQVRYSRIAARLFGVPLVIEPRRLIASINGLSHRFGVKPAALEAGGDEVETPRPRALSAMIDAQPVETNGGDYYRTDGGVGIISIVGGLVSRFDWMASLCGYVSYDEIGAQYAAALADPLVSAIVLDLDCPGGEVGGIVALGNQIAAGALVKPTTAVVNSLAASGGYWLASACSSIVVSQESVVGSIGVVGMHVDQSGADQQDGLVFTPIYAGAHKIDGSPHAPLTDSARVAWQSEIDQLYTLFCGTVATNRGMDVAAVMATEARCMLGADAIAAGLADQIGTLDQVIAGMAVRGSLLYPGSSAATSRPTQTIRTETIMDQITADVIRTEHPAIAAAFRLEGVTAERERVSAILNSDQAKTRKAAAMTFATQTSMPSAEALAVLGTLPEDPKVEAAKAQPFEAAMAGQGNPKVATEAPAGEGDDIDADIKRTAALLDRTRG